MSENQNLQKSFKTRDVLAMAFGSMIGWGWIMLAGEWADQAGMLGAILAYGVGAILCIVVGLAYAELTPAIPFTGGGVVFAYKGMGYWPSVFTGIATVLAYLGVAAWEGPGFSTAVNYLVEIPRIGYLWTVQGSDVYISVCLVAIIMSVIITAINYFGASATAAFQTIATVCLIVVGLIFLGGGVFLGNTEYTKPLFTDFGGFAAVLLMVPSMFVGFDVIPQSASEMDVPLKKIPSILIISICMAAAWYMLMILATCLSAPSELRAEAAIPVADAMANAFGSPVWGKVCIVGAICGILTSWNGFLYGSARCLYSLANAKMMPAFLGKIHPKHKTPSNAVLFVGFISTFACLLGSGALTWLVNAAAFGTVLTYFMVVLSFVFLRKNMPNLERPYRVPAAKFIGTLAVLISIFFICLYLPFGPSPLIEIEWAMVLGWIVLGFILAFYAYFKYKDVTPEERASLMFRKEE